MTSQFRIVVSVSVSQGSLSIPVEAVNELGLSEGDTLTLTPDRQGIWLAPNREWSSMDSVGKEPPITNVDLEAEGVLHLIDVWAAAVRVFGSDEKARGWIESYVPALEDRPVAMLTTGVGRKAVSNVLKRIETGDLCC